MIYWWIWLLDNNPVYLNMILICEFPFYETKVTLFLHLPVNNKLAIVNFKKYTSCGNFPHYFKNNFNLFYYNIQKGN